MEIQVTLLDAERLTRRLEDMLERAEGLRTEMPAEFATWQEVDMNRRRADVQAPDPDSVYTIILPRGREPYRATSQRTQRFRRTRQSTRKPILRPELKDALDERMRELLKKTFAPWA